MIMLAKMHNFSTWVVDDTHPDKLRVIYKKALEVAGFKILDICDHHFEPQGYTILYLLAESHFAIHTFPEAGTYYIELSSCVENQFNKFLNAYSNGQIH